MADMNDSTARPGSNQVGDGSAQVGVLAGIRVADFSRVLAGPYVTMMLADFGADVIRIEPPGGDGTRSWLPPSMRMGRRHTPVA